MYYYYNKTKAATSESFKWSEYVTSASDIEKFDLVVNHCPTLKMMEYDKFDH
jgi:hypothetical protein